MVAVRRHFGLWATCLTARPLAANVRRPIPSSSSAATEAELRWFRTVFIAVDFSRFWQHESDTFKPPREELGTKCHLANGRAARPDCVLLRLLHFHANACGGHARVCERILRSLPRS